MRYWDQWYRRIPSKCIEQTKKVENQRNHGRAKNPCLSLKNLTGAFVVLLIGYALALLIYISEEIVYCYRNVTIDVKNEVKTDKFTTKSTLPKEAANNHTVVVNEPSKPISSTDITETPVPLSNSSGNMSITIKDQKEEDKDKVIFCNDDLVTDSI